MGENEQSGMLRTVVVVGLVAMIALIVTLGVVGMKASMSKNTDTAVSTASMNQVVDSEFMNPISTTGPSNNGNSWFQTPNYFNDGSWRVAGKYRNSNYIVHSPAANETRADLLSPRQELPQNSKVVSYGAWVKGNGVIQIGGFKDINELGSGSSWTWKEFNVSDWTYISQSNLNMSKANYVSFDIISLNGSPVSLAQPMIKFSKNIGSVDYIPTD